MNEQYCEVCQLAEEIGFTARRPGKQNNNLHNRNANQMCRLITKVTDEYALCNCNSVSLRRKPLHFVFSYIENACDGVYDVASF